jgi:hypothetical protein
MPVNGLQGFGRDDEAGGGGVGRQRDIMDVADTQQALNVRVVGVGGEGVNKEKDRFNMPFGYLGGDLRVTPVRAGEHKLYVEVAFVAQELTGCARPYQFIALKDVLMRHGEGDNIVLFTVVGDQCKRFTFVGHGRVVGSSLLVIR